MMPSSFKRGWVALLCVLLGSACSPHPKTFHTHPRWHGYRDLQVDHLHLGKGIHAKILPASDGKLTQGAVQVAGQHAIAVRIDGNTLSAACVRCQASDQINMKIYLPRLNTITLSDDASASIGAVKTHHLHINHTSSGNLTLAGHVYDISRITQRGMGSINAYWVNADRLRIQAYRGNLTLAGHVNHLVVVAQRHAWLHLRDLRSRSIWIQAAGRARVQLTPLESLQAWARGRARVRYTKALDRERMQRHTSDHASVLFNRHAS